MPRDEAGEALAVEAQWRGWGETKMRREMGVIGGWPLFVLFGSQMGHHSHAADRCRRGDRKCVLCLRLEIKCVLNLERKWLRAHIK